MGEEHALKVITGSRVDEERYQRTCTFTGLQLEQSGAAAGDDENADVIDDQPEILSGMREMRDVMNRVVETVNDMEELIQDVITPRSPRRGHSLRGLSSQRFVLLLQPCKSLMPPL